MLIVHTRSGNVFPFLLQFHSLAPMYYRGSAAAVIVYDITKLVSLSPAAPFSGPVCNEEDRKTYLLHFCCVLVIQDSFQTLKKWVKELKEHGPEDIVVAIAGNKNDLGDIRWVCFGCVWFDKWSWKAYFGAER